MHVPYIGVTGITQPHHSEVLLEEWPRGSSRKLMLGVLASWKSVRGIPLSPVRAKRYPPVPRIPELLRSHSSALNLIHYSLGDAPADALGKDLTLLHEMAGPYCHGFQLNIPWPDLRQLSVFLHQFPSTYIVLQLGAKAIKLAGGTPQTVVHKLKDYRPHINAILFDLSGGLGKDIDVEYAYGFLQEINSMSDPPGLGAAGGLGPGLVDRIVPLLRRFPGLSLDAEGKLLGPQDGMLNLPVTLHYLAEAHSYCTSV